MSVAAAAASGGGGVVLLPGFLSASRQYHPLAEELCKKGFHAGKAAFAATPVTLHRARSFPTPTPHHPTPLQRWCP